MPVRASFGSLSAPCRGNGFLFNDIVSADLLSYNVRTKAVAAGWDGVSPLVATITINSGVYVGATTTAGPAFDTDLNFPNGSTLTLNNAGTILGAGGVGANGKGTSAVPVSGLDGSPGGLALKAQFQITINNTGGTISGGGGGGGSSASDGGNPAGGGGGGGAGSNPGNGGSPGASQTGGMTAGQAGTKTTGGLPGHSNDGYVAGQGGAPATAGNPGASATLPGGNGGAPGAAVNGNSFITWTATGTRNGAIT